MNKLPEKLNLLRKNSGLPQSEIAKRLFVPVAEYMNWENGNSIPDIMHLKALASLYHVDVTALLDNTMTFVTPNINNLEKSATIPFQKNNGMAATQQLDTVDDSPTNVLDQNQNEDLGATKVMNPDDLAKESETKDASDEDDEDEDWDEEDEKEVKQASRPRKTVKKKQPLKKRKTVFVLAGCIAAVAVLAILLIALKGRGSSSTLSVGSANRLVLGSKYSLYLDSDGKITSHGTIDTSKLSNAVQISGYDETAAALKKDGTVVTTNSSLDTSDWSNITDIAMGEDHIAAVRKDGSVECTGSDTACKVSDWQNVSSVYAGKDVTVALTKSGTLLSSGGIKIPSDDNIKLVALSDNALYYVIANGAVQSVAINGGSALDASSISNITALAAGNDVVAGLKKDGTVVAVSSDSAITDAVKNWKNVSFIAAHGNTLIAITKDGKMYGAGDNTYNQYENTADASATASASASADASKLSAVNPKHITFTVTTDGVQIKWDPVTNADYYEVTVSPSVGTLAKSASNSAPIPASSLSSGTTYTVSIVAKANDPKKYPDSDASTVNYTYNAKTIQLDAPSGLSTNVDPTGALTISWKAVSNASYYDLTINGESAGQVSQTFYTISGANLQDGTNYTIGVAAGSNDSKYGESSASQINVTYSAPKQSSDVNVAVTYVDKDSNSEVGTQTVNIGSAGSYSASGLGLRAPDGYKISDESKEYTISSSNSAITVYVEAD
ncbi:MAG: helix-turn-helix domain-containing protein [Erysipelotrichaceae bacterium]|nr:helix-turn-helix domain-containing protein [Erysipelotrichaceae bacterium]